MKKLTTRKIRKELAILIQTKQKTCTTDKEKNKAVEDARQEINTKYGKGWREKYEDTGKSYDDWWEDCNLDGTFAYNGCTDDF